MNASYVSRPASRSPRGVAQRAWPALTGIGIALVLAACSEPHEPLQRWMDAERQQARPRVDPLISPRKFDPQPYVAGLGVDPFSPQKLTFAMKREERQPNSLLASQMQRRREPLEAFPLDALVMVGSVGRGGRQYALLRADNLLHQVKIGDYMGQNYGKIVKITETEITLREIVQDTVGEWIERNVSLQLQERGQEKVR
jgi:type IV pilus assembly protein PilP